MTITQNVSRLMLCTYASELRKKQIISSVESRAGAPDSFLNLRIESVTMIWEQRKQKQYSDETIKDSTSNELKFAKNFSISKLQNIKPIYIPSYFR